MSNLSKLLGFVFASLAATYQSTSAHAQANDESFQYFLNNGEWQIVAPQVQNGELSVSFISARLYDTGRDDDYAFEVEPTDPDGGRYVVRTRYSANRGRLGIMFHMMQLPSDVRVERKTLIVTKDNPRARIDFEISDSSYDIVLELLEYETDRDDDLGFEARVHPAARREEGRLLAGASLRLLRATKDGSRVKFRATLLEGRSVGVRTSYRGITGDTAPGSKDKVVNGTVPKSDLLLISPVTYDTRDDDLAFYSTLSQASEDANRYKYTLETHHSQQEDLLVEWLFQEIDIR